MFKQLTQFFWGKIGDSRIRFDCEEQLYYSPLETSDEKSDTILISIIVPVYNVEKYLKKCIESLINQTYARVEIICVDDGSTDHSGDILDEYARSDKRIKVIHKENGGLVSARKAGKRIATGDYLMDVDGDDWIEVNRVEVLVKAITEEMPDLIYMSGMYRDTENTSTLSEHYFQQSFVYKNEEIENKFLPLIADSNKSFGKMLIRNSCHWVARAEIAKDCQEMVADDVTLGEDTALVYWYLQRCKSVTVISNPTYHYLQYGSSISHQEIKRKEIQNLVNVLKQTSLDMQLTEIGTKQLIENLAYYCMTSVVSFERTAEFIYPFSVIKKGSRIAVYGCGGFGQRFVNRMMQSQACQITCSVDKNVRQYDEMRISVHEISKLTETEFEYVAIAIINEDIAVEVKQNLIKMGIPETKVATIDKNYMTTDKFKELFL